jgi:opacity protein-like surface antigen
MTRGASFFLLFALVAASRAGAEEPGDNLWRGVYVGIDAGRASHDIDTSGIDSQLAPSFFGASSTHVDRADTMVGAYIGVRPAERIALELGYIDFGRAAVTATTTSPTASVRGSRSATGASLDLLLLVPTEGTWLVYGRFGAVRWDSTLELSGGGVQLRRASNGTDFKLGIGWQYEYASNLGLRLDFQHFALEDGDINSATAGLIFKF